MKVKNIRASVIVIFMTVLFLCACEKQQPDATDQIYVGVASYNQSDTFISQMVSCLKEELEELENDGFSVSVTIRDAAGSQRTQDDQVEELIDAGCNVLCVNLVDRSNPSEIIDMAREHNVPCLLYTSPSPRDP